MHSVQKIIAMSLSWVLFGLGASAAIITERNDVYKGVGCQTPSQYTFIGGASHPGIESCWIPYGTYSGGLGGTEYLRVTSNLVGVAASALGGLAERQCLPWGGERRYMLLPTILPEMRWGAYYEDDGSFLSSTTNLSFRIADQLNRGLMTVQISGTNYNYTFWSGAGNTLEPVLLSTAMGYGSRQLESLLLARGYSIEPPISSEWNSLFPFYASESESWRYVYPMFGYCTNDIHFLPDGGPSTRVIPSPFNFSGSYDIWGHDVAEAWDDLQTALAEKLMDITIEDVLSADTGWKYEVPPVETNSYWTVVYRDIIGGEPVYPTVRLSKSSEGVWYGHPPPGGTIEYIQIHYSGNNIYFYATGANTDEKSYGSPDERNAATTILFTTPYGGFYAVKTVLYDDSDDFVHWRNGTTRLDWKRLGIICQLERQMDTTYVSSDNTDELPYYNISADHSILYKTDVEVPLPIPDHNGQTETVRGVFSNAIWEEDKDHEFYHSKTNDLGWCYPTCRVPAPSSVPGANFDPRGGHPVRIDAEKLEEVIADLCAQWTNNLEIASFYGKWLPLEGNRLGLRYTANHAEGWVNVVHPSNTVAVSTSDGFSGSGWRETPIDGDSWRFGDNPHGCYVIFDVDSGIPRFDCSYTDGSLTSWGFGRGIDFSSGSITIPAISFHATNTSSDVSEWMWQATGISGTNGVRSVFPTYIEWRWDDGSYVQYTLDSGYFRIQANGGSSTMDWGMLLESWGDPPTNVDAPSISLSWRTSSYTKQERAISDNPLSSYAVSVDPLTETNGTYGVMSGIDKHSSAAFTFATAERRDETIARFSGPYYRSYDWSRIKTLRMSDLELLLSCSGSHSMADSWSVGDDFTWQYLRQWSGSGRLFRFVSGTDAYNRQSAENARYNLLSDLSAKCKSKCTELGGMPIISMENCGKVTNEEKAALINDLRSARVEARFYLTGIDDFYIEAAVHWDENKSGYVVDQINSPLNPPYTIGSYDWSMTVDCNFSSTANQYRSTRADAHQAPVEKTLWKFKNLRDPNL